MWPQLFVNGLIAGSSYGLVALGFTLIYGAARFFHFTHAAIITVAAYATFIGMSAWGLPPVLGVTFGILCAGATGAFIEFTVYRAVRAKGATPTGLLLSSLGLYVVIQNIISLIFGDNVRALPQLAFSTPLTFLGSTFTFVQAAIFILNALLYLAVFLTLKHTRLGLAIRAVSSEPGLARIKGMRVDGIQLWVMIIGSCLAGVAGIMAAMDTNLSPNMGFKLLLMGVVGAMIGGMANIGGAFLGGLLIGLLQHLSAGVLATQWQDSVVFILLILLLVFRPKGILGASSGRTQYD